MVWGWTYYFIEHYICVQPRRCLNISKNVETVLFYYPHPSSSHYLEPALLYSIGHRSLIPSRSCSESVVRTPRLRHNPYHNFFSSFFFIHIIQGTLHPAENILCCGADITGYMHAYKHTCTQTHAHTHARTHARTHAHPHPYTHHAPCTTHTNN